MSAQDTIGALATEIGLAFQPLADAFGSPNDFATFMEQLGWNMNSIPQALSGVAAPAAQIGALIQNDEVDSSAVAQLLAAIVGFVSAVSGISSEPAANFPPGLDVATFKSEFPQQTLDYLVVEYLLKRQGGYAHLLKLAGIISTQDVAESATRPAFTRRTVAWSGLGDFFSNPSLIFQQAYNWGQPTFLDDQFLQNVAAVLHGWGVNYRFAEVDPALFASLTAGALDPDKIYASALQVPFFEELYSGAGGAFGLELYILPQTATSFAGFAILPYASGDLAEDIPLSDSLTMHIRGQAQAAGGFAILFRPNNPLGLSTGAPGISANFSFGLSTQNPTGGKQLLLGSATGSRLEYSSLGFTVGLRTDSAATSFYGEVSLADGDIVIEPGADADSFLTQLLPSNLTVDASITLGLDSRLGVYFSGSTSLEITIPAHISLGPIEIQSASISIAPASGSLPVSFGATIQGNLGPLQAVVDDVGLTIPLTFPGSGGNLGPMNASLAFKPPKGVGLTIDAGVVQGGGYLYIDTARGQYAGALQLEIADFLSVAAIGLISTKLPDGSPGFSLLIILTADFGAGIQLSFGFTLLAVGGLLGLNRTMLFQPLMDGIRTNSIQSVMFPQDVVANAPRIISDLQAIFPPQNGTFLIGPMAKIGWGEPTLISLSLGVIIEIPPGDAAILGILRTALPADQVAVLVLQVNFAGVLEFDKQRFYFYASLFDSHILFITISGSMGVLFAYGDNANFVLSVGGFHPQFTPPPLPFPAPERISLTILNESYARIHADGYFAVTTNTVQFGSHADFFFGFSACSLSGSSGFDALIQFSPFHFIAEISTQFSVQVFGIGVYGIGIDVSLSGPGPWHVHGTASLSFFFFSISIGIDFTWGDNPNTTLPPVAVMPILVGEAQKASNWKTALPANTKLLVVLRQLDPSEAAFVLHPAGTLQISQRSVPLDLKIDRVGSQPPSDANQFTFSVSGTVLTKVRELQEQFAPSQFQNFDDATKLSQPAYVPEDSGVELAGSATLTTATAITRPLRYDLTVIDKESEPVRTRFFANSRAMFTNFLGANSAARSKLSANFRSMVKPQAGSVAVSSESFAVALQSNNQVFHPEGASFSSQAQAQDYINNTVAANPALTGTLHVIPQFEVAA